MRVKTSVPSKNRHKKLLARAKGYRGTRKTSVKLARQATLKAGVYSYRDRRAKKRVMRAGFITTVNNGAGLLGLKYSLLINKLKVAKVEIDRKVLASLAQNEPEVFKAVVEKVK